LKLGELKPPLDLLEVVPDYYPSFLKLLLQQALSVEVEQIEDEDANPDIDLFELHILPSAGGEDLKALYFIGFRIESHYFTVQDELASCTLTLLDLLDKQLNDVGVGLRHVLQVAAIDPHHLVFVVNLTSESIILELARKSLVFKAIEHVLDGSGRLREHRATGNHRRHPASLKQGIQGAVALEQSANDPAVVGIFTDRLLQIQLELLKELQHTFRIDAVRLIVAIEVFEQCLDQCGLHCLLSGIDFEVLLDKTNDVFNFLSLGVEDEFHYHALLF